MKITGRGQVDGSRARARISALRWLSAAALLGATAGACAWGAQELLPAEGAVPVGVRVAGIPVTRGAAPQAAATAAAARLLEQRFTFTNGGQPLFDASLAELGATVDIARLAAKVGAVGHEGTLIQRIDTALEARRGNIDLKVAAAIPVEPLAARLARIKEERDAPPLAARLDLAKRTATTHTPGRYLDVYAAAAALDRAIEGGAREVSVPMFEIAPSASSEEVAKIDTTTVVSRFETRYGELGDQRGRAQNIRRAASQMEGLVLMPGETVSFNVNVGPRSEDNGFATAPEIYKGEMREGIGGGTCQVSGTLHAAAYLAGIEIVERSPHSRPSGYIRTGLDATVVFPTVDLKLRNPYDFPMVVHAVANKGALVFELLGREKPAKVELSTTTVGTSDYKRKIEEDAGVGEGKMVLKQRGIRGVSVRKTRTIHAINGLGAQDRVEVTTDVYPPTYEIWKVGPGADIETLPPLPQDERTAENGAGGGGSHEADPRPREESAAALAKPSGTN
jgi:vancomycin resistance protein YoaR